MKATNVLLGVLLSALVLMLPGLTAAAGSDDLNKPGEVPSIKKDCTICHGSHDSKKNSILLIKPLETLCIGCHSDRKQPNEHRVDVVPIKKVRNLPLANGKVTCITCHDPHKNTYRPMLRMPARDLCIQCHSR